MLWYVKKWNKRKRKCERKLMKGTEKRRRKRLEYRQESAINIQQQKLKLVAKLSKFVFLNLPFEFYFDEKNCKFSLKLFKVSWEVLETTHSKNKQPSVNQL